VSCPEKRRGRIHEQVSVGRPIHRSVVARLILSSPGKKRISKHVKPLVGIVIPGAVGHIGQGQQLLYAVLLTFQTHGSGIEHPKFPAEQLQGMKQEYQPQGQRHKPEPQAAQQQNHPHQGRCQGRTHQRMGEHRQTQEVRKLGQSGIGFQQRHHEFKKVGVTQDGPDNESSQYCGNDQHGNGDRDNGKFSCQRLTMVASNP